MRPPWIPLYAYTFFKNLVFAYVIERLFWEARSMSVQDVVIAEIIFVLAVFALEIPAGILADRVRRKSVLIVAALCQALEFAIILFARSFAHFALAVSIAAVGEVLISGTFHALVYDALAAQGREAEFRKQIARLTAFDNATLVVAFAAGGVLSELLGMELLYAVGAAGAVIAALCMGGLSEQRRRPTGAKQAPPLELVKRSIRAITTTPAVLTPVLAGVFVAGAVSYLDEFAILHLRDAGLPVWSFGVVAAVVHLLHAAGNLVGDRLSDAARRRGFYLSLAVCILVFQSLFGFSPILVGVSMLGAVYLLRGAFDVLVVAEVHDCAESEFRATAESVVSQLQQMTGVVFGIAFGIIAGRMSVGPAISMTAVVALVAYLLLTILVAGARR